MQLKLEMATKKKAESSLTYNEVAQTAYSNSNMKTQQPTEFYIGDAVYLRFIPERNQWALYTSNGVEGDNVIYLEPETMQILCLTLGKILVPE